VLRKAQLAAVRALRAILQHLKMADAMHGLVDSAAASGVTLQSIAKPFETRERSRSQSEKLKIRRARLEGLKWLYDNLAIPRAVFLGKVSDLTDQVLSTSVDE
jgi:hypothetical protein